MGSSGGVWGQSDEELTVGLDGNAIDLRKVGCSTTENSATFAQIDRAREGRLRQEFLSVVPVPTFRMNMEGAEAMAYALMGFIGVNLLGLALVAVLGVLRWVAQGFATGR